MTRTLAQWLDYQQSVHARGVDLGLARVGEVWRRLGSPRPAPLVFSVGGTNGKGSTVAFLEAMLRGMGLRVGCYTSPHLLRYNERVRIEGRDVDDADFVAVFERIDAARGDVPLTYFEYGTLAALLLCRAAQVDAAVLEVGLGGRLDAVNLIDADVAIVTTVDLDHQDWLGNDRDAIGREKAGIFRRARPAVIGDPSPPPGLLDAAQAIGASLWRRGGEFEVERLAHGWRWRDAGTQLDLPPPALAAPSQIDNAAAAIAALRALGDRLPWDPAAVSAGIARAHVAGRLQQFAGPPALVVDVAHNAQAARELGAWLAAHPPAGRNLAVFGALEDKDLPAILEPLLAPFPLWFGAALDAATPRGRGARDLRAAFAAAGAEMRLSLHADVAAALDAAAQAALPGDRVVAFGSFFVAAPALAWIAQRRARTG